jgi:hypothetical protein
LEKQYENAPDWDPLLFKYIVSSYSKYPLEAKRLLTSLKGAMSPEKLLEAVQPASISLEFSSLLEILKMCKEHLTPETLLVALKHAKQTMSALDCRQYCHLLSTTTGDYYAQRGFAMLWERLGEVLARSQEVIPLHIARNLANGALDDFKRAASMHSLELSTPMTVLYTLYHSDLLLDSELQRFKSTPSTAQFFLYQASFPELAQTSSDQVNIGLKKVKKLLYPCSNRQLLDTLGVLRGNPDRLREMDKEFMAVCGKQISIMTIEEIIRLLVAAKAENGSEGDQLSAIISEEVANYWKYAGTKLSRNHALKVLQVMSEPGNYHAGLWEVAQAQIDISKLDIHQKLSALSSGLSVGGTLLTDWLAPIIETIQGDNYLLARYGSQVLSTFHDSNTIKLPQCVALAQHYLTHVKRHDHCQQHFSYLQSAPYLLRAGLMTPDLLPKLQAYLPKDGEVGWEVRRFVLEKLCKGSGGNFNARSSIVPMNHPYFAHPKMRKIAQTYLGASTQSFPADMPLAPLYLPSEKTAIWLHPPKLLLSRGDQLQGDYKLYKGLLESQGCKVVALPMLPQASGFAIWKVLRTRIKI